MGVRTPHASPVLDPKRAPNPQAYVESFGAFALDGSDKIVVRAAEAAPDSVLRFSDFSAPETIRNICLKRVPGWSAFDPSQLVVDQLCEGLTNQLFKVHLAADAPGSDAAVPCVLFRIYGKDCATLIDQDVELRTFKVLSDLQIAPKLYAHEAEWRIEEWHKAVPLRCRYMRNPSILTQVASSLGRLHKLSVRQDFPRDLRGLQPASMERMRSWASSCEAAAADTSLCAESKRSLENLHLPEVLAEQHWLRSWCIAEDPCIRGSGLDVVFSHSDLQENNILQTQYGLRFIDFEYSSMDYQAYDIANYFNECCLDYVCDKYPFYSVSLSDYPTEWEQRLFCCIYLSEYLETRVTMEELAVTRLLARVRRFTLVSHYLWTVWSVVRAPSGVTYNDFDFLHYAQVRWDSYKRAKTEILVLEEALASQPPMLRTPNASLADLQSASGWDQRSRTASEDNFVKQEPPRPKKRHFFLGGALTGGGVLVGVAAVVLGLRLLNR